ncbi:sensor histidine kinase [Sulfurospirillum arsenophilum]|uniref:sensor histidine kinase n=1 Tax=Sulfurospirillum arsenophilum TaxID=56698 RepID=UPI0009FFA25E|nr:sensor histidine kinase [Sulfurospirillum arsenophilum]
MKNLFNYYLTFMNRLWCQLAISYALLSFFAIILIAIMLNSINNYTNFHTAITLENVERIIDSEELIVTQAILDTNNIEWLNKARNNIREKLINLEQGSGSSIYRITSSSSPKVYIEIIDKNGYPLISDFDDFSKEISPYLSKIKSQDAIKNSVIWLAKNGAILADKELIKHDTEELIGHLRIVYIAEFDPWIQFKSVMIFLFHIWGKVLLLSVPIGIICGLIASRYVTKQLQKMNEITESWRQGNFQKKISLPNDDVLMRHSEHLNNMARDLEMYLNLKQNLAISDERNRLARELHDTVKQKLFALGLQMATIKTKSAAMEVAGEHIFEAEAITREAQHDLMEIITQLHPIEGNNTSLFERIVMIAEDFKRRFGISIELKYSEFLQCNTYTEHHILRIVQESLINAVRHGKASKIVIASERHSETITLTIIDNGVGFMTEQKTGGLGLISMHERVQELIDGTFDIKSTVGVGTQITLSWRNES